MPHNDQAVIAALDSRPYVVRREHDTLIDLTSAGGTAPLGAAPNSVIRALIAQLEREAAGSFAEDDSLSNTLSELLRELCALPGHVAMPATTGTEAVDLALRVARKLTRRSSVAFAEGAFHGATTAAAAVCGLPGWQVAGEDRWSNVKFGLPTRGTSGQDSGWDATKRQLEAVADQLAAVIIEPLQSNRAYLTPDSACIQWLAELCNRSGCLLIADEIGSGMGRGGHWLGSQVHGVVPDVVVLGKVLAAGTYPIAAVMVRKEVREATMGPGMRSSLSWTRPGCAAAIETLTWMRDHNVVERVRATGEELRNRIKPLTDRLGSRAVVGMGMGWGIRLGNFGEAEAIQLRLSAAKALKEVGVLVEPNPGLPGLRIAPALTMPEPLLWRGVDLLVSRLAG